MNKLCDDDDKIPSIIVVTEKKMSLPRDLKKEIQVLISVDCKELVFKGKDASEQQQYEKLEKTYFGTEEHESLLDHFLNGDAPFDGCFDLALMENNREGNDLRAEKGCMLELKRLLHRQPTQQYFVHEKGFVREQLMQSRGRNLSGRTINENALLACKNFKHALKFATDCMPDGKLPSGTSYEDMIQCVLEMMFVKFQGAKDQDGLNRHKKKVDQDHKNKVAEAKSKGQEPPPHPSSLTECDMPEAYFFSGFFTFVLFGPEGSAKFTLAQLATDDSKVPKESRKKMREKEAKEKELARKKTYVPDDHNRRGISLSDRAEAARLSQKDAADKLRALHLTRVVAQREGGCGCKILKFHSLLHIVDNVILFGAPLEGDTSANESHHKPMKQAANLTQKRHSTFNLQTGFETSTMANFWEVRPGRCDK